MSGSSQEETNKNYNKIIKNIVKETIIDKQIVYTFEHLKMDDFNKPKLYTTIDPDTRNVKPFIIINSFGIFVFSKSDLFINTSDVEHK